MKKYLYIIFSSFVILLLVMGFIFKQDLNSLISTKIQSQAKEETSVSAQEFVQKNYNYNENGKNYDFTFLEFSSSGCTICKQMEPVLDEIRGLDKTKVNVVFLHIMKPENLNMMKFYGISAVPMQILLDKEGNEFFRHYGFISTADLLAKFDDN